jgi:Tol biopolymer transport system component
MTVRARVVHGRRLVALLAAALAVAGTTGVAGGAAAAPATVQVSVDTGGGDPDGGSHYPSISPNGRHVSFQSSASDLVPDDGNRSYDVFARDLVTGTTRRVSVDLAGGDADGPSVLSSMSWSGRYVAFESDASDLVAGDGNGLEDVFVRDMVAGVTTRVTVDLAGGDADGDSYYPSISADGRYVAFESEATDLVAGDDNGLEDVFVRDLATGTTERASVDAAGDDADGESEWPRLSADGRLVAFHSEAGDLVPGDDNDLLDVYVRDLVAGTTTRVSVDGTGGDPNGLSYQPSISADGRHVAFGSAATDLVAGGDDGLHEDVFVRDLVAGVTTRVSVDVAGGDPDQTSRNPSTSGDGRYVAFYSEASDLVAGDGNGVYDVFVRDVATGTTTRVSVDRFGGDPSGLSSRASISEDGRRVAFRSLAWDLVPGGPDHRSDVFVRILG